MTKADHSKKSVHSNPFHLSQNCKVFSEDLQTSNNNNAHLIQSDHEDIQVEVTRNAPTTSNFFILRLCQSLGHCLTCTRKQKKIHNNVIKAPIQRNTNICNSIKEQRQNIYEEEEVSAVGSTCEEGDDTANLNDLNPVDYGWDTSVNFSTLHSKATLDVLIKPAEIPIEAPEPKQEPAEVAPIIELPIPESKPKETPCVKKPPLPPSAMIRREQIIQQREAQFQIFQNHFIPSSLNSLTIPPPPTAGVFLEIFNRQLEREKLGRPLEASSSSEEDEDEDEDNTINELQYRNLTRPSTRIKESACSTNDSKSQIPDKNDITEEIDGETDSGTTSSVKQVNQLPEYFEFFGTLADINLNTQQVTAFYIPMNDSNPILYNTGPKFVEFERVVNKSRIDFKHAKVSLNQQKLKELFRQQMNRKKLHWIKRKQIGLFKRKFRAVKSIANLKESEQAAFRPNNKRKSEKHKTSNSTRRKEEDEDEDNNNTINITKSQYRSVTQLPSTTVKENACTNDSRSQIPDKNDMAEEVDGNGDSSTTSSVKQVNQLPECFEFFGKSADVQQVTAFYIPLNDSNPILNYTGPKFVEFEKEINKSRIDFKHAKVNFNQQKLQELFRQEMRRKKSHWKKRRQLGLFKRTFRAVKSTPNLKESKPAFRPKRKSEKHKNSNSTRRKEEVRESRASSSREELEQLPASAMCAVHSQSEISIRRKTTKEVLKDIVNSIHLVTWITAEVYCSQIKHIANTSPRLFGQHLSALVSSLLEQIAISKSKVAGPAIKVLKRLYDCAPKAMESECDRVICGMLAKLGGPIFIDTEVLDVLKLVVANTKPIRACLAFTKHGVTHRMGIARSASARSLCDIIKKLNLREEIGDQTSAQRRLTSALFDAATKFNRDTNISARDSAREIYCLLLRHPDFWRLYLQHVPEDQRLRVNRLLDEIRRVVMK